MQRVSILPLGAGCEVGRSCLILTINQKKIMLDCGLMINKEDTDSLPLLHLVKAEQLSMVIITHAHLDHCGALPYFLSRHNYRKKVYMTKPTKDIYHYLVRDTVKVQKERALFDNQQILDSLQRIFPVEFGVQLEDEGIKITPYVAGHIVGAAMFIIEVDGVKVLYTGDYSCEEDRYIMKAEIPQSNVDILISESTFGIRVHESRHIREQKFQECVRKIVKGGGKCLLPVFSAGRAEELLFILDEYWEQKKEELGQIHIYFTVSLIDKCKNIYETYIDMLSTKVRERFYKEEANPFKYRYIRYLKENKTIYAEESKPMVVMCTPGMLQNGQSRTLLERWCHDPRNGVIITGYCAEGSIASNLKNLKKGDCISSMENTKQTVTVNLQVEQISFAAHADCLQTTEFIKKVKPAHVVLVHGSGKNAQNLRQYIEDTFKTIKTVTCPKNEEELTFDIQITEKYHIAGELIGTIETMLKAPPRDSLRSIKDLHAEDAREEFNGYIVSTNSQKVLLHERDKDKFFPELKGISVRQRLAVNYIGGLTLAQLLAQKIFGEAETIIHEGEEILVIKKCIHMTIVDPGKRALVEFLSSQKNDIIADQFCFLLANILYDPLLEENLRSQENTRSHTHKLIFKIVQGEYPESTEAENIILVRRNGQAIAVMNTETYAVDASDEYMRMRLSGIMDQCFLN